VKRFLVLLLTVCLLLGVVVLPTSAATNVTLNTKYGDATKSATGTAAVYGNYSRFSNVNGAWMEWPVNVPTTGAYRLSMTWSGGNADNMFCYPQFLIDGICIWSGKMIDTTEKAYPAPDGSSDGQDMVSELGTYVIPAGNHTLRLVNAKGYWYTNQIKLESVDVSTSDVVIYPDAYTGSAEGLTITHETDGISLTAAAGSTFTNKVYVPATGQYGVILSYKNTGASDATVTLGTLSATLAADSAATGYTEEYLTGALDLEAGIKDLTFSVSGEAVAIDSIKLVKLDNFAISNVKAQGNVVANPGTVKRGADAFTIAFNQPVKENTIITDNIKLTVKNGAAVPVKLTASGSDVLVHLEQTLAYGTEYNLTVAGVKDVFDRTYEGEFLLDFRASGQDGDSGSGTVEVTDNDLTENVVTIEGTVASSVGVPIAGRSVKATVTPPSGTNIYDTQAVTTGVDGSYTLVFNLDVNGESGEYSFVVSDEYAQATPFTFLFVSNTAKNAVTGGLKASTTTGEVEDVLDDYDYALGVSYPEDLAVLEDGNNNLFLSHFIGFTTDDINKVRTLYDNSLLFETLNQANTATTVLSILGDAESCTTLGFDQTTMDLIVTNQTAFHDAVAALTAQESKELYKKALDGVVNTYLAQEFGKSAVALSASSASGYPGQGVDYTYAFASEVDDVVAIEVNLELDEALGGINEDAVVVETTGDCIFTKTAKGATLKITMNAPVNDITKVFTISLVAPDAVATHNIKTNGVVTYSKSDAEFTTSITEGTTTLTVNASSSSNNNRYDGISSTTSSISKPAGTLVPVVKPEEPVNPNPPAQEQEFEFTDLASVDWAKDSINTLLKKGIISQSENGCFDPNRNVSREEYVKMLVVAMNVYDSGAVSSLSDVDPDSWYASYIASAEKAGLITGDEEKNFGVGQSISRQDMAVMTYRALVKAGFDIELDESVFADDASIAAYAKDAIYALKTTGILNGVGNNEFAPAGTATRAMAAKVINGMLEGLGI